MDKLESLKESISRMGRVLVAFSGGVDSTFLLRVAHDALGDGALAATALTSSFPGKELEESKRLAALIGARQVFVETHEMDQDAYRSNTPERCYFCKGVLFEELEQVAEKEGCAEILYGETAEDRGDYRPGARAAKERRVRAPLAELGFTKLEIRRYSKDLGLPTWDKPSMACLASRIPYGSGITPEKLKMVELAEDALRGLGLRQVRVRHHDSVARIEVDPKDFPELTRSPVRDLVVSRLKEIGYRFVTLDLQGYRMGSLNEELPRPS